MIYDLYYEKDKHHTLEKYSNLCSISFTNKMKTQLVLHCYLVPENNVNVKCYDN